MAKTKIGSNATFSGTQQGITIAKEFFYGYSGQVDIDGSATLFSFHTGKYVSVGQFQMVFDKTAFGICAGRVEIEITLTPRGRPLSIKF